MIRGHFNPVPPAPPSLLCQLQDLVRDAERQRELEAFSRRGGSKGKGFETTLAGHVYEAMVPGVRYDLAGLTALLPDGTRLKSASCIAFELARKNRVFKRGTPGKFTYERPVKGPA